MSRKPYVNANICLLIGGLVSPSLAFSQGLERPLSLNIRQAFSSESNVLSLPAGSVPPSSYGTGSRSDFVSSTNFSGAYRDSFGTQNATVNADLGLVRYSKFSRLDRNVFGLGAKLDGDLNPMFYESVDLSFSRQASGFNNQIGLEPNLVTSKVIGGTLGFRFNPTWSAFGRLDYANRSNSAPSLVAADSSIIGKEFGLRYQPQSGIDGSLVARRVDSLFANQQKTDLNGVALPSPVSNNNHQNQLFLRINYQPTGISTLTAEIGVSAVSYDSLSQRNSSGLLLRTTYNYKYSDALTFSTRLTRDTSVTGAAFSSNVQTTSLGFDANWQLTGRTSVRSNIDLSRRNFLADAAIAQGLSPSRVDNVRQYGVGVSYELLRNLYLNSSISRIQRSSNIAALSSSGSIVLLSLDLNLR